MTDDKKIKPYKIQIDKKEFEVEAATPTARELLVLAGKVPPEHVALYRKEPGQPQRTSS